jgi:uncharacterized tellurite resistance protein B-like protein
VDIVKIEISQEEWVSFPIEKREQVKELLMEQFGYDISSLDDVVEELEEEREEEQKNDIFRQFYGDEKNE